MLSTSNMSVSSLQPALECVHVSDLHKTVLGAVAEFLQGSPLPCFDHVTKGGHWRCLVLRNNSAGEGECGLCIPPNPGLNCVVHSGLSESCACTLACAGLAFFSSLKRFVSRIFTPSISFKDMLPPPYVQ